MHASASTPHRSSVRLSSILPTLLAVGLFATAHLPSAAAQTKPTIAARVNATRHQPKLPASRVDDVLLTVKEHFADLEELIGPAGAGGAPIDYIAEAQGMSRIVRADAAGRVRVLVHVSSMDVVAALVSAGMTIEIADDQMRVAQGWVPANRLEAVAAVAGVVRVRPVLPPMPRRGSRTSAGVAILHADALQALGVDGRGIRIGVISDGIAGLAEAQTSADLPPVVQAESGRTDGDVAGGFGSQPGAEGTAMLEIIHDLAPGAELFFANMDSGPSFRRAMRILAYEFDCDIIIDDIGVFDEPFFEDGAIAVQAEQIVQAGKVFVSAAGNSGVGHYQGTFAPAGVSFDAREAHDFGGGDTDMALRVLPGEWFVAFMQWNTPHENAAVDLDLALFDAAGNVIGQSAGDQGCSAAEAGGIVFEYVEWSNETDIAQDIRLAVGRRCPADVNPEIEIYFMGHNVQVEHVVAADSVFGHPAIPGVIGCGAVDAADEGLNDPEYFSSRGPATVYTGGTDDQGLLTTRAPRPKPDISSVDGVEVTGFGGFPTTFYGTSASAPHVAACAALLWSAQPSLTSDEVRDTLLATARDIGVAGFDQDTGIGMVDALAAVMSLNEPPVANDDAAATDDVMPITILVTANDTDANGDVLVITEVSEPNRGSATIALDGVSVVYTPVAQFAGDMEFTYAVADRWGASATGTVVVKVGPAYLILDDDPTPGACGGAGAIGLILPVAGLFGLTGLMRRRSQRR